MKHMDVNTKEIGMYKELNIEAKTENLNAVLDFLSEFLEETGCSMAIVMQLNIAVEEIFVNIANYAYTPNIGMATIQIWTENDNQDLVIVFSDCGYPYDPLSRKDPDVTLSAEERPIGGLGIYMVKKSMDSMKYEYIDGKNCLTLRKSICNKK